ncbi:ABC transporter ATP-binding protein [Actinoplanes sp. NPDC026619]|uniref:ABC transporter ATP-binding protein n=1 Tax=Actinoplanes sp. NPDC026619 TaxID=3155798 RepID=UPI0033ED784D
MTLAIEAVDLGMRYGSKVALTDCNLAVPVGRTVGLVGPNGAGKSTLLGLMCGLMQPTTGSIKVLGERPAVSAAHLARVGFVAQDTPLVPDLTVGEHLKLGAKLNPRWDRKLADDRIRGLGLDMRDKARRLSGGQGAQLALAMAAAKRPELLIFDEPVAALDPLARRRFLQGLMEIVAELSATVVLSSHVLSDLERVCDYLIVVADGRVQIAGEIDDLISTHYRLLGAHDNFDDLPPGTTVIQAEHTGRQSTLIVHAPGSLPYQGPQIQGPQIQRLGLEELVLAYMSRPTDPPGSRPVGHPQTTRL